MNKKNLWLSRYAVWVVLCLAVPIISQAETYSYDMTGRLTIITYNDGYSIKYTYDNNSNITSRQTLLLPDTDNDGIPDHIEDVNQNGLVDPNETDPNSLDTDGDGIQDGTELGYTLSDIGPNTDTNIFQPDLDSTTTTNPLDEDTDGDRWQDGTEDLNHNGRIDPGEKDPKDPDSKFEAGDINGDGNIDLTDAILGLQIVTNLKPSSLIDKGGDISEDGRIGIEEVVYILQKISGL